MLLVEDDDSTRENMEMFLYLMNISFKSAKNQKEGLTLIKDFCPQILLADLLLGDGDASPIIKYCRENYPKCKSVLMTAMAKSIAEIIANQLKVDHLVYKPFNLDELETLLKRLNN